jgi:hypothetical protein
VKEQHLQKRKSLFDHVLLDEVLLAIAQQDRRNARNDSERSNGAERPQSITSEYSPNVQKKRARPKRSIKSPGDDHELGLWIDYDLLRKHQSRMPQIVIHDPVSAINNRYLELADIALRGGKSKKRSRYRVAQ